MRKLAIAAALLMLAMPAAAQSPRASEYDVKAAFLYNFVKFVQWPSQAFPDSSSPIRVCVLGRDPFGSALENIVQGKSISGRPVVHLRLQSPADARLCHVLFISGSEAEISRQALERTRDLPVLTVGENGDFLHRGGMINFVLDQDRVRFEINLQAAERHRLKLSSKLLGVARVVDVGGGD